ncbi:MAG TPA: DUF885 domain-containing protein [Streptosporangiaceae bacterium]
MSDRQDPAHDAAATERFRATATRILDALFEARPVWATELGDHRHDGRLPDLSSSGVGDYARMLSDALVALDALDTDRLDPADQVDLEILRTRLAGEQWEATELAPHTWDPLVHLPGDAIYTLLARDPADAGERLRALAGRLRAIPESLAAARDTLGLMPRVHVETAIAQARGALPLLGAETDRLLERAPSLRAELDPVRTAAADALTGHIAWLEDRLPGSDRDPRLGGPAFAARLWYTLDTEMTPDKLLTHAESDLMAVEEQIAEAAARVAGTAADPGQVREVLDGLAASAPVDDRTIVPLCAGELAGAMEWVRSIGLVTVPDVPIDVVEMPESRRGVAVAYCDPPGMLEPDGPDGPPPTFFAVSPTPASWSADRVASFYREYNGHVLRGVAFHEAVPGHALQLAHARGYQGRTPVRAALWSGPFVEGWACYAEELMAEVGASAADTGADRAIMELVRLKMYLRSIINAILDVRVHAHGMTEGEAMELMTRRGHQEEGEAVGKWRRAQLTSAQLSTYYVGHREVREIVKALERDPATEDRCHDLTLAYGSPPPRHLHTLLGLGER